MLRKSLLALAVGAALAVSVPAVYAQSTSADTGSGRVDHRSTTSHSQDTSTASTDTSETRTGRWTTGRQRAPSGSTQTGSADTRRDWRSNRTAQAGDTGARDFGQTREFRGDRREIAQFVGKLMSLRQLRRRRAARDRPDRAELRHIIARSAATGAK
jgi:hypothetical protein